MSSQIQSEDIPNIAKDIRVKLLNMIYNAKSGHTGGSLSCVDILVSLYFQILCYDPANPDDINRDRFILSKGHSVEAYYATLAAAGFISDDELSTYGVFNSRLFGHPTKKIPGIEAASGALGHGLSIGLGMAIAALKDNRKSRVYVLMGDGEQAEGSIWEAAMAASHYHASNLVGIIDYNKLQISGNVDDIMKISCLKERWNSFGWNVIEVDGNDILALIRTFEELQQNQEKPTLLIAHTIKGKGVSFMENNPAWHHKNPTEEEFKRAISELESAKE